MPKRLIKVELMRVYLIKFVRCEKLNMGAGHQADGTSSRIVKLGTSSRKFSH